MDHGRMDHALPFWWWPFHAVRRIFWWQGVNIKQKQHSATKRTQKTETKQTQLNQNKSEMREQNKYKIKNNTTNKETNEE